MYNSLEITYKKVKNLKISIKPDGSVAIVSPEGVSKKQIIDIIKHKKNWIEKQQQKVTANSIFQYKYKELKSGDIVYFLGKAYQVALFKSKHNVVCEKDNVLEFYLGGCVINNVEFKQELLHEFFRDKADLIFNNLVAKYLKITNQDIFRVSIKQMKTRWGSCNHIRKTINLNLDLVTRDIRVIEYVVLHEIAHLTHPNHSKDFYNYVAQYMPDWKKREQMLK